MAKMSTSERIQFIKQEIDCTSNVLLGELAGASKSVVGQWISGDIKEISPKYAYALEEKTPFSAKWIMLGEEPKLRATGINLKVDEKNIHDVLELMQDLRPEERIEVRAKIYGFVEGVRSVRRKDGEKEIQKILRNGDQINSEIAGSSEFNNWTHGEDYIFRKISK